MPTATACLPRQSGSTLAELGLQRLSVQGTALQQVRLTTMIQRRQQWWGAIRRIPKACTTCTGTCLNGAGTNIVLMSASR